jgi:hypothetical protein
MKNLMPFFFLFFGITALFANEKTIKPTEYIKAGTELHYIVNNGNNTDPFIVKIVSLDMEKGITFDYDLRSSTPLKARVEMLPQALNTAQTMYNYFSGKNVVLNDRVSVFVSGYIYYAINKTYLSGIETISAKNGAAIKPKTAWIQLDANDEYTIPFSDTDNKSTYKTDFGNIELKEIKGKDTNKSAEYTIRYINDAGCPLITYMNLGWTVELTKIVND